MLTCDFCELLTGRDDRNADHTIEGVLKGGKAVCEDYSRVVTHLCQYVFLILIEVFNYKATLTYAIVNCYCNIYIVLFYLFHFI